MLVVAGAVAGSGAVAGAGAAGAVSLGFVVAGEETSEVAVGVSSFLDFFLKRLLKPFFSCAIASGATIGMRQTLGLLEVWGCEWK